MEKKAKKQEEPMSLVEIESSLMWHKLQMQGVMLGCKSHRIDFALNICEVCGSPYDEFNGVFLDFGVSVTDCRDYCFYNPVNLFKNLLYLADNRIEGQSNKFFIPDDDYPYNYQRDGALYRESLQINPVNAKDFLMNVGIIFDNLIENSTIQTFFGYVTEISALTSDTRIFQAEYAQPFLEKTHISLFPAMSVWLTKFNQLPGSVRQLIEGLECKNIIEDPNKDKSKVDLRPTSKEETEQMIECIENVTRFEKWQKEIGQFLESDNIGHFIMKEPILGNGGSILPQIALSAEGEKIQYNNIRQAGLEITGNSIILQSPADVEKMMGVFESLSKLSHREK